MTLSAPLAVFLITFWTMLGVASQPNEPTRREQAGIDFACFVYIAQGYEGCRVEFGE